MTFPLDSRTALVTGAGRGIGRAVAVALAAAGARVACCARTTGEIEETAALCGEGSISVQMDLSAPGSIETAVAVVTETFGGIDILVNNGGIAHSTAFAEVDLALWRRIHSVNLDGAFLVTKAVLPGMLARDRGRVIMMSSVFGRSGGPFVSAYASAKHGLIGLTRALASEYARTGVTFNAVCPGFVDTVIVEQAIAGITGRTGMPAERAATYLHSPQGRLIDVSEVAAACVYLASDAARSITGQSLGIDGGRVQW